MKKDISALIFSKLRNIHFVLIHLISSIYVKIFCKLVKIKMGEGNLFNGITTFKRASFSSIIIGNNNRFLSRTTSNLIGINHKCIIATHLVDAQIIIGNNCGFSGTVIGAFSKIIIGNNVKCGANTLITDSDWHLNDPRSSEPKPVFIADNVWLGYGVIVMKGVTIGENSVIGAASIVTKDIPRDVIAAGNPCKILREIKPKK